MIDKRLKEQKRNVKVNCVHPGWCKTEMGTERAPNTYLYGAEPPIWLSEFTSERDDSLSGNFYYEKTLSQFYV